MALAKWGVRQIAWGAHRILWGADVDVLDPDNVVCAFGFSAEYPPTTETPDGTRFDVWTGFEELTLGGITYSAVGPKVIEVGAAEASITSQGRMSITLSAIDTEFRQMFLQDPGSVTVTARLFYSSDGGNAWQMLPRIVRGQLSRPQLSQGRYTIEISPYRDTIDRGYELTWSDDNQRRETPGDRGLEHLSAMRQIRTLRWPP